jgi:membrane protein DedA with SNARE-associated domain/membrane-associated phospholipid phosphatase
MLAEIKPFLNWLHAHPDWAGFAIFLVSFAESIALLGLLIPGSVVMTAIGALVATGNLNFISTSLWAAAGAILGDTLSFFIGYHFKQGARRIWPLSRFPKLLEHGEVFFKAHGGKSVFLGRFVGPVRPILPLIAGMFSMSPLRFIIVAVIAGIIWPPIYMLPGLLVGAAAQALPPEAATRFIVIVLLIILVLSCVSWLLKRFYFWIVAMIKQFFSWWWNILSTRPQYNKLHAWMLDPMQPNNSAQLTRLFLFAITSLFFLFLATNVYLHGFLTALNLPIYHLMRALRSPTADPFFVTLSLFKPKILAPMWLAVFIYLLIKKHSRAAWHWFAIGILIMGSTEFFKFLIHNPRPTGLVKTPSGWSFPSGHTTGNVVLLGFFAVLLCRGKNKNIRYWAYSLVAIFCGLVILSRLYLTEHWLTDVVGGILLACACIALVSFSYHRKRTSPIAALPACIVAFVVLALSVGYTFHKSYHKYLAESAPYWQVSSLDAQSWWTQNSAAPLYRTNHFGKPTEALNVQWAGSLTDIEQQLSDHGWVKIVKPSIFLAVGLANKNHQHQPFVINQLYEDRKAVLQMTKAVDLPDHKETALLVFRLWNSNIVLSDGQTLWYGIVTYHKPWHIHFLKQNPENPQLPIPLAVLTNDLAHLNLRKISFSKTTELPNVPLTGNILLIMPKANSESE